MEDNFKEKSRIFERYPKTTIIFIIMLSIVVTDVLLTKLYNYYKYFKDKEKKEIRIKHTVYHHTFKKNSKSTEIYVMKHTLFTNSLGFKDKSSREVSLKSTNKRILFIGDSFCEGIGLNYEDTYVGMIDAALSKQQIEVLNAGRASYSPIIYWRKIKYLIENAGLQFDEVVVFIDISDAWDEIMYYDLSDKMNVISVPDSPQKIKLNLKKFIFSNTTIIYHVLNFLHDSYENFLYDSYDSLGIGDNLWRDVIYPKHVMDKWTIDKNVYNAYGKDGVKSMIKYMNRLLRILRDNGIDLTIAVYPWPSQVWYEDLNSIQVNIWKIWSEENDVKFINFFPDFVSIGLSIAEKNQILIKYYLPADMHFNKEGNKIIANKFIRTYFKED